MTARMMQQSETRSRSPRGHPAIGLHGHPLGVKVAASAVTEAVGTFILVFTIAATAIAASLARPVAGSPYESLAVPVAGGLALAVVVATLGRISGSHVNPAVTLGLAANRRFPWTCVPAYLLAQLVGASSAALTAWAVFGDRARSVAHLAATQPAPGVDIWRAFGTEAVVTFILVLAVVSLASDSPVPSAVTASSIGAALAIAILISGPITGAGVNPARSLGPMIVAWEFTDWWVYLTAPLLGGTLAVTLYDRVLRIGVTPTTQGCSAVSTGERDGLLAAR